MKQLLRKSASVFLALALVLSMFPILGGSAYAESSTITGAPTGLTVSTLAEGETSLTISWTPNLTCGIDSNSGIVIAASTDGKVTWEAMDFWDFTAGFSDITANSYANDKDSILNLDYGKTYYFKAYYIDEFAQAGPDSNIVGPIVCKEKAQDTSDSGSSGGTSGDSSSGSGSSGSSDSGSGGTAVERPKNTDVAVSLTSEAAGKITINFIRNAASPYDVYGLQVKYGDKIVLDSDSYYYSDKKTITVPYAKQVSLKYRVYRTSTANAKKSERVYASKWKTVKKTSIKLKKPTLKVTKISKDKAGLAWTKSPGATGYKIYKGSKLIKTVKGKTNKVIYSKKGAGSGSYKVQPVIKNSKMSKQVAGPKSKAKKGVANQRKYDYTTSVSSVKYANVRYSVSKISLSGGTYTITGYVLNNRIFDLQKFQKLDIKIYANGKVVAKKTFRKLKCSVKAGDYKKFTVKVKGKSGVDFANAEGMTYQVSAEGYWKGVGASK